MVKSIKTYNLRQSLLILYNNQHIKNQIVKLVNQILYQKQNYFYFSDTFSLKLQIDQLIYKFCYLTLKEIEIIKMFLSRNTYNTQKRKFTGEITEEEAEKHLKEIQKELDEKVEKMYLG